MSVREQLDAVEVYTDGNGGLAADTALKANRVLADGLDALMAAIEKRRPWTADLLETHALLMRQEVQRALEFVLGPPPRRPAQEDVERIRGSLLESTDGYVNQALEALDRLAAALDTRGPDSRGWPESP